MSAIKALRAKLVSVNVPQDQVDTVEKQIRDVIALHMAQFSAHVSIESQMRSLALDCYTQGLLDGAQVGEGMERRATAATRISNVPLTGTR